MGFMIMGQLLASHVVINVLLVVAKIFVILVLVI